MNRWVVIAGLAAFAALIAHGAWLHPDALIYLVFIPFLLTGARRRIDSPLIMLGYFGYNSWELPEILLNFFDGQHVALAYAAPVVLALLLAAPFALINPLGTYCQRALQAAAAFALISLPPLGFIGWLNPLFASASLFPGSGAVGLALTLLAFSLIAALRKPATKAQIALVAIAALCCPAAFHVAQGPRLARPAWIGAYAENTHLGRPSEGIEYRRSAWQRIQRSVAFNSGIGAELLVFPESIIHDFTDLDRVGLAPALTTADRPEVWIGATFRSKDGRVENAIVRLDGSMVARNRLPVPIGNWRPFMASGVVAEPFGSDLVEVAGKSVAVSICYEDGVIWPHPGLLSGRADALVSMSNHWALRGTRTARAQAVAAHALARMADVPLLRSTNE